MGMGGVAPAYDHAEAAALPADRGRPAAPGGIAAHGRGSGAE